MECPHFVASRLRFPGTCPRPPPSFCPSLSLLSFPSPRPPTPRAPTSGRGRVRPRTSLVSLTCTTTPTHPRRNGVGVWGNEVSTPRLEGGGRGGGSCGEGGASRFQHPSPAPRCGKSPRGGLRALQSANTARAAGRARRPAGSRRDGPPDGAAGDELSPCAPAPASQPARARRGGSRHQVAPGPAEKLVLRPNLKPRPLSLYPSSSGPPGPPPGGKHELLLPPLHLPAQAHSSAARREGSPTWREGWGVWRGR